MNDRFRFRVWNKHINEYCNIQNLFILPTGETGYFITDGSYPHQRKFMHQEDMIIEQCTGLKDKNGNLIYEGDIVKAVTNTYKVIWDGHRWAIKDSQGYIFSEYINDLLYDCEIIGNIHKQPEQKDVK